MINKLIKSITKLSSDYVNITLTEPYCEIKSKYKRNPKDKTNKFSFTKYLKKQKLLTSPDIRNNGNINNCELRKTYIREFVSRNDMH